MRPCKIDLLKALWGGQHRRPSIYAWHRVAGWRKEAWDSKSAIAGGRDHDDLHTTYLAGNVSHTYLCDVSSEGVGFLHNMKMKTWRAFDIIIQNSYWKDEGMANM